MANVEARRLVGRTSDGFELLFDALDALDERAFTLELSGGWTVSSVLAHLAFWDRWVETRWDLFEQSGRFDDLPDYILDLVNAAAMPGWLAVPGGSALAIARSAAASVTSTIERLSNEAIRAAVDTGRPAMVDRTVHWRPHLEEIETAIAAAQP